MAKRQGAGFTLIELMVVVAIVGILAAMGFGYSQTVMKAQRFTTAAREAYAALVLARTAAITKGKRGVVIFAPAQMTAFLDMNANLTYEAGVDQLLKIYPPTIIDGIQGSLQPVTFAATFVSVNAKPTAIFDSTGFCIDNNGALCDAVKTVTLTDTSGVGGVYHVDVTPGGATRIRARNQ